MIHSKERMAGRLMALLFSLFLGMALVAAPARAQSDPLPSATSDGQQSASPAEGSERQAASSGSSGNVGFAVRAIIPQNQIDPQRTYFYLRMAPSDRQDLQVEVTNSGDREIEVSVSAISASTASNGLIDYRTPDRIDSVSLKTPFSALANVQEPVMRIPAGETKIAIVSISMPEDLYDGVVLGGLVFTKMPESEMSSDAEIVEDQTGTMITNVYSYVLGVLLQETDVEVLPDFELVGVSADLINYSASCVHYIRNKNAAIAKEVSINIEVRKVDSDEVIHRFSRADIEMAPTSLMELNTGWDPGVFEAGDYVSTVHMELDGKAWDFTQEFTIEAQEALRINEENLDKPVEVNDANWTLILLIVLIVLVLIILLILILSKRKKEEAQQSPGQRRRRSSRDDDSRFD